MIEWSSLRTSERWSCAVFAAVIAVMALSLLLATSLSLPDRMRGLAVCLAMTAILLNPSWLRARSQALSWAAQPPVSRWLFLAAAALLLAGVPFHWMAR